METTVLIGKRIAQARTEAGYTQVRFAEALDSAQRAVVYWESGVYAPRRDTLGKIAKLTGRPIYWFFVEDDETDQKAAA